MPDEASIENNIYDRCLDISDECILSHLAAKLQLPKECGWKKSFIELAEIDIIRS